MANLFGWVPPVDRTREQNEAHSRIVGSMPAFKIMGDDATAEKAFLWEACKKIFAGQHAKRIHQLTGSCVGAGGCNMLKVLMAVEIAIKGDPEEYKEPWWPFTYGRSRYRAGMGGQGEGSTGSGWAEAIKEDGIFEQAGHGLPDFTESDPGWLKLTSGIEMKWSDGRAVDQKWLELGKKHPVGTVAPIKSSEDAAIALSNGYPLTIASMYGTSSIRPTGEPKVQLATWNDSWAHQMSISGYWDHPTLGPIFYVQNNWGQGAHPAPLNDEPGGGFWIPAKDLDKICRDEAFAFSAFTGFPARVIDWGTI